MKVSAAIDGHREGEAIEIPLAVTDDGELQFKVPGLKRKSAAEFTVNVEDLVRAGRALGVAAFDGTFDHNVKVPPADPGGPDVPQLANGERPSEATMRRVAANRAEAAGSQPAR